jgi:hypothetical protein
VEHALKTCPIAFIAWKCFNSLKKEAGLTDFYTTRNRCHVVIVTLCKNNNMDAKGGVVGQSPIIFNAETIGAC